MGTPTKLVAQRLRKQVLFREERNYGRANNPQPLIRISKGSALGQKLFISTQSDAMKAQVS